MYLVLTARKGISSLQLSKQISVSQPSCWFMMHRIREACNGDGHEPLRGIVEVDEVYLGGKERNKHEWKKLKQGRGSVGKTVVLGMRERGGRTVGVVVHSADKESIENAMTENIDEKAVIHSDEHTAYEDIDDLFEGHETVNHSGKEFARGNVTTNGIESVWAVFKRGVYGTFHHISAQHTGRYFNEFAFRLNEGNVQVQTLDRMEALVKASFQKRLTYERLTG
jgi:transposase-like protein